jgi:methionyl-tRNA formyltransferase
MGARRIGFHLIKNSLTARTHDHEKIAKSFGIKTLYFKNPNDPEFVEFVKNEKIDLIINARTRFIYRKKILKAPTLGCLNIHHGILPDYRGTMCDLYALYENRPAGFTIHKMESKIDTGAIVRTKEVTYPDRNIQSSLNFSAHIKEGSRIEGLELSETVKIIKDSGNIPIEKENITTNAIYTKNPDFKTIRKMINKGMIL